MLEQMTDIRYDYVGKRMTLLGEAPIWRHATAQKCPKTPMGQQESSDEGDF